MLIVVFATGVTTIEQHYNRNTTTKVCATYNVDCALGHESESPCRETFNICSVPVAWQTGCI